MSYKESVWEEINWSKHQSNLSRHQSRIYKASLINDVGKLHRLQKLLTRSESAKLIATRRVTTDNQGKRTPGIDGITITSGKQKLELAHSISLSGSAKAIRRIYIDKPGKTEKRPLGIPVIKDRATQALAKLALEPQWEAHFEPNSYGFRPGRSCQDAIEAIFKTLRHGKRYYILDADISKCFDTINHDALIKKLNSYPEMNSQIRAWLKAGILISNPDLGSGLIPSNSGTPQGGIISPLLANIALHGLESAVHKEFSTIKGKASVIRYADDFVIVHANKDVLENTVFFVEKWLVLMGLTLSPLKTRLVESTTGFEFLGFHIIHVGKAGKLKVKITPSKSSLKNLLTNIKIETKSLKGASVEALIKRLRPKIIGWGNYFRYCECSESFNTISFKIFQILRPWVFSRQPGWGRQKIREKYFPQGKTYFFDGRSHQANWILTGYVSDKSGKRTDLFLPNLAWITSKKHVKVKGKSTPFDGNLTGPYD